jgi:integrase
LWANPAGVAADCGIKVSAHDLRRTFATVAEQVANVRPLALKALLNHTIGQDVTAGYVITTTEDLRASAQLVCEKMMQRSERKADPRISQNPCRGHRPACYLH